MKVVLLAGGRGLRLSEETQSRPKPMIEIGGHPILWHIMMMYWSHGFSEFIVCLGYRGYFIKEYFANYVLHRSDVTIDLANHQVEYVKSQQLPPWRVTLVDTGSETQTGGRLRRIAHLLPDGESFCLTESASCASRRSQPVMAGISTAGFSCSTNGAWTASGATKRSGSASRWKG